MFPHYFMTLLPVSFVAMALGLDLACRWQPRRTWFVIGATTVYALLAVVPLLALYRYLPTKAAAGFQYLRYTLAVQRDVNDVTRQGPVDLLGLDSDTATALVALLQQQHAITATDASWALMDDAPLQVLISPPEQTIAMELQPQPVSSTLPTVHAGTAQIVVTPVRAGGAAAAIRAMRPLTVQLVNGVRYLGWTAAQPKAGLLRVTIGWQVDATAVPVSTTDVAPYVHLVQGDHLVAQYDGTPYASSRWQAGQVIYAWFDLPLPIALAPGEYQLRTGMYTRPSIQRIARRSPNGPADGEFALGTIQLPLGP